MLRRSSGLARSLLLAAAGAAAIDAMAIEPRVLRVKRVEVQVDASARALVGARIAHISDLHVLGRGWKRSTIQASIDAVNREDVDVIALTGDFLGCGKGATVAVSMLSRLRTDLPRFAVLGNHDHVYGARDLEILVKGLHELGIQLLNNDALPVELGSRRICVAGVDDGYSARDDLEGLMCRLKAVREPRILLTHYPEVAERLEPGQVHLSLAGHSHAGQLRIPVLGELVHRSHARTKYGKGLFMVNGNPLYVSPGIGLSGVPMRFLNPPEVAIISFVPRHPFTVGPLPAKVARELPVTIEP